MAQNNFNNPTEGSKLTSASPDSCTGKATTFSSDFQWGVASAAAQVETRKGRGRSNWDAFADQKGHIRDGSTNTVNTEFESRYAEDLAMLANAGVNAFRFSFAWPRIQPDGPGAPSAAGLETYDRMIDEMLRHGMEPMPTLFHWDIPEWAGDLRDRDIAQRMADYTDIVTKKFADRIRFCLALNEPNTVAAAGYALGIHAPGVASREAVGAATHHQNLAQGLMIAAARTNLRADAKIATTINLQPVRPVNNDPENIQAAKIADAFWNRAWLDPLFGREYPELIKPLVEAYIKDGDMEAIAAKPDFVGMNYYARLYAKAEPRSPLGFVPELVDVPAHLPRTELLPVEPDGLTEILLQIHREYGAPNIYLTETGFALRDPEPVDGIVNDPKRIDYLRSYLRACEEAIEAGVKLRGIYYWAGTDNWEWAEGFAKKFGLVQVDQETQTRTPKSSLAYYSKCIKANGVA